MKPTVGRTVIFSQGANAEPANGTRKHPAIITRVWSDTCVNLQVLFDNGRVSPNASVLHAAAASPDSMSWDWPAREG